MPGACCNRRGFSAEKRIPPSPPQEPPVRAVIFCLIPNPAALMAEGFLGLSVRCKKTESALIKNVNILLKRCLQFVNMYIGI